MYFTSCKYSDISFSYVLPSFKYWKSHIFYFLLYILGTLEIEVSIIPRILEMRAAGGRLQRLYCAASFMDPVLKYATQKLTYRGKLKF